METRCFCLHEPNPSLGYINQQVEKLNQKKQIEMLFCKKNKNSMNMRFPQCPLEGTKE
jgi:hypothetical protein